MFAYSFLSGGDFTIETTVLPIHTHMQPVRTGSAAQTWSVQRSVAGRQTHTPMPSVGRKRLRSGAVNNISILKNITEFSDIHSHAGHSENCVVSLSLPEKVPAEGYFSVGIHPWDTERVTKSDIENIRRLAGAENVVAIGECGLDALRGAPLPLQEEIFISQIAISEELGKPMIIHAVRTLQRLIELRRELKPGQRWIIHGFRGKPQLAASLLRAGFDLSYGKKYNPESFAATPAERLFRESDE